MNCLIVDDEYPARTLLSAYLSKLPDLRLVGACDSALAAGGILRQQAVDLIFLDIQMPDLSGLDLLRTLADPPMAILVTAYGEHALEGYNLDVVDYLLKPVAFERFVQAVNKAAELQRLRKVLPPATTTSPAPQPGPDHFFVKVDAQLLRVRFDDILFIEGMREYVNIQTPQRRHIVYQAMKNLEDLLPAGRFARVHKSYIVAIDRIDRIYGNTVVIGSKEIPIGKSYKDAFMQQIALL
ncbi:MAG: LytTR family DNA-binding domain-containing protein [Bacteroidia bacterium]